jgi:hypothetical protein
VDKVAWPGISAGSERGQDDGGDDDFGEVGFHGHIGFSRSITAAARNPQPIRPDRRGHATIRKPPSWKKR